MTLSAKWTAVSVIGLGAFAAASLAFAGCSSTTTGTVVDDDGGTTEDSSTPVDSSSATCPGNTKETIAPIISTACQAKLDQFCCTELTNCFDIDPTTQPDAGAGDLDCNKYFQCVDQCNSGDAGDRATCQQTCDSVTSAAVQQAYDAITTCATTNAPTDCQ